MWYIIYHKWGWIWGETLKIEKGSVKKLTKLLRLTNLTSLFAKAWKYYTISIFTRDVDVADMTRYDWCNTNIVVVTETKQVINDRYFQLWYQKSTLNTHIDTEISNLAPCLGAKFLAKVTMSKKSHSLPWCQICGQSYYEQEVQCHGTLMMSWWLGEPVVLYLFSFGYAV